MGTNSLALLVLAFSAFVAASNPKPAEMAQFTPPAETEAGTITFQGRLSLNTDAALQLHVLRDDYQFADQPGFKMDQLPAFSFAYVQDGKHLIPVRPPWHS